MNYRGIILSLLCVTRICSVGHSETPPPTAAPPLPAGTVFHFVGMIYLAGRIEFRDASGELWPNYWYEARFGDVRGQMVFDPANPRLNFILNCRRLCQGADGNDLKILGETLTEENIPAARFTVRQMGAWQPAPENSKAGPCELAPIDGELAVGNRKLPVKATVRITYNLPKTRNDMKGLVAGSLVGTSINLSTSFTIKGRDLGLKKVADKDISVTIYSRAFTEETILEKTKKKSLKEAGVLSMNDPESR